MDTKNTKSYIFGLLTGLLFVPIIEEIVAVISSWSQVPLIKASKIINKENFELQKMNQFEEPVETNCIGFQIPDNDEDYE